MDPKTRSAKESKKTLTFEDYKNCLLNPTDVYRSQLMFRSSKHEVHMIEVNKVAPNQDDDERISKRDGISTLARGHKSLPGVLYLENYHSFDTNYKMVGTRSAKICFTVPRARKSVIYHTCECGYIIRTCSVREISRYDCILNFVISLPKLLEKMRFVLGLLDPQPI